MSGRYRIAETEGFQKEIQKPKYKRLQEKIRSFVYPQLRSNPFFGPNIKRLKGKLDRYYRFRTGSFRLFYTIEQERVMVFIVSIADRRDAYR